jgi:hypothetical protein
MKTLVMNSEDVTDVREEELLVHARLVEQLQRRRRCGSYSPACGSEPRRG